MTYSIGFRTPAYQELAEQFLVYLQDRIEVDGMYADPDIKTQKHPSEISSSMLRQVGQVIKNIRWDKEDIANFLGCYLSEPKPHIYFDPPEPALSMIKFHQAVQQHGLSLALKTQLLCHSGWLYMNGEAHHLGQQDYQYIRKLADERKLSYLSGISAETIDLLYEWYLDGYILPIKGLPVRNQ